MKRIYVLLVLSLLVTLSHAQSELDGYEYWFNSDYANKIVTVLPTSQQLAINRSIPTTGLLPGVHSLNFRSFDNDGKYSSVASFLFYKTTGFENSQIPAIATYEYWFDNDYAKAVTVSTAAQKQVNLTSLLLLDTLSTGLHRFNIRFRSNAGLWSSLSSTFFYKEKGEIGDGNTIMRCRYWFDDDLLNAVLLEIAPKQRLIMLNKIDLSRLSMGIHEIHFQFKDSIGTWSSVLTDTIERAPLPVADFDYTLTPYCDSTIVSFSNSSLESDEYLWDFGDDSISTATDPVHTYYSPGTYSVVLNAKDHSSGYDSTVTIPLEINSLHTASSFDEFVCESYLAPDGEVYTSSGTINAIIPNAAGCDSLISINLTVSSIDTSVVQDGIVLSATESGALYQWLDCSIAYQEISGESSQTFSPAQNGSYAVKITQNNCSDTSSCYPVSVQFVESSFGSRIVLYPNPTKGTVSMDLGTSLSEFTLTITDVYGKIVSQETYYDRDRVESHIDFEPGVYFLTIDSDHKKYTIKLIKN